MTNYSLQHVSETFKELTGHQQQRAIELAREMNLGKGTIDFGQDVQEQIRTFSHTILGQVKDSNMSSAGTIMNELLENLEHIDPDELSHKRKGFFSKWFRKGDTVHATLSKYQKIGAQMEKTTVRLRRSRESLLHDNEVLEQLYQQNEMYYEDLCTLIAAGEMKKAEWLEETLPSLRAELEQTANDLTPQKIQDLDDVTEQLDQRLYDLQMSQQIAMQTAPQIRMIQKANQTLAESIESSILTTLPIWKHQIAIALSQYKQKEAGQSQHTLNRRTDELFKRTAYLYQTGTQSDPALNQTLQETQQDFVDQIRKTIQLQLTETEQRQVAEQTLSSLSE
ncbi:toxic anion resistance protein [Pontibacillus sp. ALD_SL1]|uniref:toxic anion resistance protein n=1 Tax=Pontibacillus sp. ALD_SL1 TaxID=2777185 RepID=UPI001A956B9B|nr:toxic anion resistance protein [Pontibacillus sp. ALD_SL1]QST01074.1 toxic anion resistance protein [Pontibacillus sp. ALD_SL1]